MLKMLTENNIRPWKEVWKKATTAINAVIAGMALAYPMISETMREDLGDKFVMLFAVAAVLNVVVGNLRQKNLA